MTPVLFPGIYSLDVLWGNKKIKIFVKTKLNSGNMEKRKEYSISTKKGLKTVTNPVATNTSSTHPCCEGEGGFEKSVFPGPGQESYVGRKKATFPTVY